MPDLTQENIKNLIQGYFQDCLNRSEEIAVAAPNDTYIDISDEVLRLRAEHLELKKLLVSGFHDAVTRIDVQELLGQFGAKAATASDEYRQLCDGVLRARLEDRRILAAKLARDFEKTAPLDPMFAGMAATELPPVPGTSQKPSPKALTVALLADRYCAAKKGKVWVPKTYADNLRVLKMFKELVGENRPIMSLCADDVRTFRDALENLPANYTKAKEFQDKTLPEVLSIDYDGPTLSAKTGEKYFFNLRGFLNWCREEEYLKSVPGEQIKFQAVTKAGTKKARFPYTNEQLQTLFSSPIYTGFKSVARRSTPGAEMLRDGKYWIPLVGLFSGLRLGEIVQLLLADIKEQDGVLYFDIARGEDEEKQIKTESSVRRVPIHPTLIQLGLMRHVENLRQKSSAGRVFPEIQPGSDGYFSHNFSKWYGRYSQAVGVKSAKTAFHSLRHTFKDAMVAAGVPEDLRQAIMGHSDGSVHAQYGSTFPISQLYESVKKVAYPQLDLGHLQKLESNAC